MLFPSLIGCGALRLEQMLLQTISDDINALHIFHHHKKFPTQCSSKMLTH